MFQNIPSLNEPLLAYDQNHGLDLPGAEFDGVTEQWFTSIDDWIASLDAPEHTTLVEPDVAYMLDPPSIQFVLPDRRRWSSDDRRALHASRALTRSAPHRREQFAACGREPATSTHTLALFDRLERSYRNFVDGFDAFVGGNPRMAP